MRNVSPPTRRELPRIPARRRPSVAGSPATAAVEADDEIRAMTDAVLVEGIAALRAERNATILAHNYQRPEIQALADAVGDSLDLARFARDSRADVIVLCGVHFMAETAALLAPERAVLIPDPYARCSLAASVTASDVRAWRDEHPDGVVVSYVNTTAEVKAESDSCCTSRNAVDVLRAVPEDADVLFLPDAHLGRYVEHVTGRRLHLWLGECHVHAAITRDDVEQAAANRPDAHVVVHPECGCIGGTADLLDSSAALADRTYVLSTGGMLAHARACEAGVDLVATEVGMLHRLHTERPDMEFVAVREDAVCEYMKSITLAKLYRSLRDGVERVGVPEPTASRARESLERMLAVSR